MTPEDVSFVIALCRSRAGLKVVPEKTYLIESRLAPIARGEGFVGAEPLLAAARESREPRLLWRIIEAMASSETSFFRDRDVFDHLRVDVIPDVARARTGGPVRVWSAACSTGQEVYSLAMIAKSLEEEKGCRLELSASDLSTADLERAQSGLYSQSEVQRGLPIGLLIRYFQKQNDMWRITSDIRSRVRWRRVNLVASLDRVGCFDVVLCRNVLSAMTAEAQRATLASLAHVVAADGYLVLGLGERAEALNDAFEPVGGLPAIYRPTSRHSVQAA
ncbi:MAG: CheR family methyltransferase [Caulobacteraceae bacterium]